MSLHTEKDEIAGIVNRLLDSILSTMSSQINRTGINIRVTAGDLRAHFVDYLKDGTFAQKLLDCFTAVRNANVELQRFALVHQQLFSEVPKGPISQSIVGISIVFCLSAESRMVSALTFTSRDDVDSMINIYNAAFETARLKTADSDDTSAYICLINLGGALVNHLANVSRPLPRIITISLPKSYPSLALSQRIYYVGDRADEIVDENKIVHPAFCPKTIRGLSA
jgi:prophage DNA circulation protein